MGKDISQIWLNQLIELAWRGHALQQILTECLWNFNAHPVQMEDDERMMDAKVFWGEGLSVDVSAWRNTFTWETDTRLGRNSHKVAQFKGIFCVVFVVVFFFLVVVVVVVVWDTESPKQLMIYSWRNSPSPLIPSGFVSKCAKVFTRLFCLYTLLQAQTFRTSRL